MKKFFRVQEAAEQIGVSASALRSYTNAGKIISTRNPAGQRLYTQENINLFLGITPSTENKHDKIVFYVRSSDSDKVKIDNQIKLLTQKFGTPIKVYKDNASGLSEKRVGLNNLIEAAEKHKFNTIMITQKDRLTRFGFHYLEKLFQAYGVTIIVLGNDENKTLQEELLQDFMSLLASFSGKFYRIRGHEQKKLLLEKVGERLEETN